jgi:O-antigen/teichoic acid export membrane protein
VILFLRSYFAGLMLFKIDTLLSVLDKFILILLAGYLLYFSAAKASFTMNWFVGAQFVSYALSACIAIGLILAKIGIPKPTWSPAFSKVMLRKSLPYALLILLMMLYNRVDAVMIERLHPAGQAQAGIYAQSFRILDALLMFAMLFSNLLFPIFARLIRDKQSIVPLLNSASRMLLSFSIIAACCAFYYAETILSWIYRGALNQSLPVFSWLMLSFVPICITLIYGTLLTANGSLRILNKLSFVGLLANVFLNVIFIHYWGAWGAALATLLTQTAVAILQLVFVSKSFQLQFNLLDFARYLGFVGWLISTVLLLELFSVGNATLAVFFGSSVVALFVFRMLDWKTLLGLLQKNHS